MIKNIPNKYTQKMLLAAIDESFRGTYDFFYLPIDFKNKCNVGYAFINMIRPVYIVGFVDRFNYRKWEKFNSEKVRHMLTCTFGSWTVPGRAHCAVQFLKLQLPPLAHLDVRAMAAKHHSWHVK